jgi:hypothetical protein
MCSQLCAVREFELNDWISRNSVRCSGFWIEWLATFSAIKGVLSRSFQCGNRAHNCLITDLLSNNQMWDDQTDLLDLSNWDVTIVQEYWFVGAKSNLCVGELPRLGKTSRIKLITMMVAYHSSHIRLSDSELIKNSTSLLAVLAISDLVIVAE